MYAAVIVAYPHVSPMCARHLPACGTCGVARSIGRPPAPCRIGRPPSSAAHAPDRAAGPPARQ
ncbi:conserved hypothetical protein [Burkholderia mallei PRL-20]|uniref:Uncharacterized protein n=2 Tax=pseudomallei group TaxID=111527 RepID=A2S1Z8_BURM9|nr:conserved hypothetical protein [Burkholderia mallei NCTC 10229]EDK61512.1 hypothetical protein BMAJHU_I0571 [Burkholderia mallei JHU]EEP88131.1 conserved hypothetical protein [Burkholderia mallei GB8 horse 4]EES43082.1 conserved hypothetical protein [Burkholderia mallei PRL-20]